MKKSRKKTHIHRPSLRTILIATWVITITTAVAFNILWTWDAIQITSSQHMNDYSRLVSASTEGMYRQPIVDASEKKFIIPELDISMPYDETFSDLQYGAYKDGKLQQAYLTTSSIITASTQVAGSSSASDAFDMPYFYCNKVLALTTQHSSDHGALLDTFSLADGRTLYAYEGFRNGTDCNDVYGEQSVEDLLDLVSQARPYQL